MNHKDEGVSIVVSRYTNCLRETEGLLRVHDTYGVRVGQAIEVEIKIPNNKHLTSKEIAVFQKITKFGEEG